MEVPAYEPYHLRLATIEDVPALHRLIDRSIRHLGGRVYDARQIESSLTYVFGVDTALIRDKTYFVVEVEGEVVGAGGWSRRRTHYGGDQHLALRDDRLRDPAADPAAIRAFYVDPDWARRGIGSMIMEASEAAAHKAGFRSFELLATLSGVPLYEHFGYRRLEAKVLNLPDGITLDGYHMAKP